ncbi:MAG TPA: L,D-transpeptidase [Candidatus Deferrimicrobium sp.]|nr:L,D-transpeptidase [Candidatus Deferrimicrobium sp.]
MRRRLVLIGLPLAVGLAVFAVVLLFSFTGPSSDDLPDLNIQVAHLPDDTKLAKAELTKARKDLAKLVPAKPYVVINTHANTVSLRAGDSTIMEATASTGTGGELIDSASGRRWVFATPHGVFKVDSKLKEPWWRKPDWAFIEENEKIPKNERDRLDPQMMGDYAIGFGDGFFIHGTIYERLLGISVTHGCVRLGAEDIKKLYEKVRIGTLVYVF